MLSVLRLKQRKNINKKEQVEELKKQIQELIKQEKYEEAAIIRDKIRKLESK